jgi:hypothetical protein
MPGNENIKKVLVALKDFGMGSIGITEDDFSKEETVIQLGMDPNRIDLITSVNGVSNENIFLNTVSAALDGIEAQIIPYDNLLKNKECSGRPEDLQDIIKLKKIKKS